MNDDEEDKQYSSSGIGSLLQLAARGPQCSLLSKEATAYMFNVQTLNHTPFIVNNEEYIVDVSFGGTFKTVIPIRGDFIKDIFIKFQLPDVNTYYSYQHLDWKTKLSQRIMKKLTISINNNILFFQNDVYAVIQTMMNAYRTDEENDFKINHTVINGKTMCFVHIPFWNKTNLSQFFPIGSLHNTNLDIKFDIQEKQNLLVLRDGLYRICKTRNGTNTSDYISIKYWDTLGIPTVSNSTLTYGDKNEDIRGDDQVSNIIIKFENLGNINSYLYKVEVINLNEEKKYRDGIFIQDPENGTTKVLFTDYYNESDVQIVRNKKRFQVCKIYAKDEELFQFKIEFEIPEEGSTTIVAKSQTDIDNIQDFNQLVYAPLTNIYNDEQSTEYFYIVDRMKDPRPFGYSSAQFGDTNFSGNQVENVPQRKLYFGRIKTRMISVSNTLKVLPYHSVIKKPKDFRLIKGYCIGSLFRNCQIKIINFATNIEIDEIYYTDEWGYFEIPLNNFVEKQLSQWAQIDF